MSGKTIAVWFRNDLRVHDNEILLEAVRRADKVIPLYCIDPRYFQKTKYGTLKTGHFRAKFILESIERLRNTLKRLGGDLVIRQGLPEDVIPELCLEYGVSEVYHHREVASAETKISENVEAALWKLKTNLKHFIGHTLYHKEDLPFPIKDIPDGFSIFRKKIERDSDVRPGFSRPEKVKIPENIDPGFIPDLRSLGFTASNTENCTEYLFKGGEDEGLLKLSEFLKSYQTQPRGTKAITHKTSLLSPWLSAGCISPREVYWQVKSYERDNPGSDIASSILLELQWRDYFRFMLKKHGSKMTDAETESEEEEDLAFERWTRGESGFPLADASITELNATGFINNRSRYSAAAVLVKDMGVNWRAGAAYFEEKLIDYSPASNWGNWTYIAGEGVMLANKPITFKPDPASEEQYINQWLRKLKNLQ